MRLSDKTKTTNVRKKLKNSILLSGNKLEKKSKTQKTNFKKQILPKSWYPLAIIDQLF